LAGSTHRLGVTASGDTISLLWDGVPMLSAVEALQQTSTRHGLVWSPAIDSASVFDNFQFRR
jgi:hypothetical protein